MMSKERQTDMAVEKEVNLFLQEHFYSQKWLFDNAVFISDIQEQKQGKDVVVKSTQLGLSDSVIDEKCAATYVNKNIPTFALELSQLADDGKQLDGWLLQDNYTQYYLLLWPNAENVKKINDTVYFRKKDITSLLFVLIEKNALRSFLNTKGFGMERLKEAAVYLREQFDNEREIRRVSKIAKDKYHLKFSITKKRAEKPINVLVYREDIIPLSVLAGICTPEDIYISSDTLLSWMTPKEMVVDSDFVEAIDIDYEQ